MIFARPFRIAAVFAVLTVGATQAQEMSPAEETRMIENGKEIFKTKATCQF